VSETQVVPPGIVQSAIEQIFQTMYFTEAGFVGRAQPPSSALGTTVGFFGETEGEFRVTVSERLACDMAADFLALEPGETSPEQVEAIVREFANVACGATLGAWKPGASFHCAIPGPLERDSAPGEFPYCFCVSGDGADLAGAGADLAIDIRIR